MSKEIEIAVKREETRIETLCQIIRHCHIATAYGVDRAALIVDALNKQESEAEK